MSRPWPELSAARDRPTIVALHLYPGRRQGADRPAALAQPWLAPDPAVTPRGLGTEPLHAAEGSFTLGFDFADHLFLYESAKQRMSVPLQPMPVADFHGILLAMLARAGHQIHLHGAPNEVDPAIPFAEDRKRAPTTATARGGCTRLWSRRTGSSACSAPPSSARSARSISSGAASTSPSPASRAAGAAPSGRHPQPPRRRHPRGLQPRSLQRRLLAGRGGKRGRALLLFLRLSDARRVRRSESGARSGPL